MPLGSGQSAVVVSQFCGHVEFSVIVKLIEVELFKRLDHSTLAGRVPV